GGVSREKLPCRDKPKRFVEYQQSQLRVQDAWETLFRAAEWEEVSPDPEPTNVPAKSRVGPGGLRVVVPFPGDDGATYHDLVFKDDVVLARRFDEGEILQAPVELGI